MSARKRGLGGQLAGQHFVDEIAEGTPRTRTAAPRAQEPAQKPAGSEHVRVGFYVPAELLEALRDAVDALSGPPVRLTLNALVRDALARELARLQAEHHRGKPFPKRPGRLRAGRARG